MTSDFHERLPVFKGTPEEQFDQAKDWIIHHSTWVNLEWASQRQFNTDVKKHFDVLERRIDVMRRYFWMGIGFVTLAAALGATFGPAVAAKLIGG